MPHEALLQLSALLQFARLRIAYKYGEYCRVKLCIALPLSYWAIAFFPGSEK
jgi:hypothetical protein